MFLIKKNVSKVYKDSYISDIFFQKFQADKDIDSRRLV